MPWRHDTSHHEFMHAAVIINPISGARGRIAAGPERALLASRVLARNGIEARVSITRAPGHARDLARELVASGAPLIFAWGGDGTVNEVAAELAFHPASALAIIPAGSGNGLARELRIPLDPEAAIRSLLAGAERSIDGVELDGHLFFNVAGIGIDAEVARIFNRHSQGRRGLGPYVRATLRALASYRPATYDIDVEGTAFRSRALFIALANARQYGRGAIIAPGAILDDGRVDIVAVGGTWPLRDLWRTRRLFSGTIDRDPLVSTHRTGAARISTTAPMLFHVDGEVVQGGTTVELRVHAGALRIRVPSRTSGGRGTGTAR